MKSTPVASETRPRQARPAEDRPVSRRALLTGAAGIGGIWSQLAEAGSLFGVSAPSSGPGLGEKFEGPFPIEQQPDVRYLVDRLTFGRTLQELTAANLLGYEGYLEHQLNHTAIADPVVDAALAVPGAFDTLTLTPYELLTYPVGATPTAQLTAARVLRATYSRRQLLEVMVEFWTDHFNIDITNGDDRYLKTVDDREVIRAHALGKFPDMLRASAHSPAMLLYLDNNVSRVGIPNENYARELFELHTLGVDGGYTQHDVEEAARALTGWTFYGRGAGPALGGRFWYRPDYHDNGQKIIFAGTKHELVLPPGLGKADGDRLLDALAVHPSTARFIATKLTKHLWGYNPPAWLIDRVASTYLRTGGDIKEMIRTIFLSPDVPIGTQKYKRPLHYIISGLRAVGATITNYTTLLRNTLPSTGHTPFRWTSPDGYPDTLDYWSGLILPRWNFAASFAVNQIAGVTFDFNAVFGTATTRDQVVARLNVILGGTLTPAEQNLIRSYMPNIPSTTQRRDALGLALGAPSFQWF